MGTIYKVYSHHQQQVADSRTYDVFGNLITQTGTTPGRLGFQSRYLDPESGLYYFYHRYYTPPSGRFINEDPAGIFVELNLYKFVGNNPIKWIDPFGLHKLCYDNKFLYYYDDCGDMIFKLKATSGRPGTSWRDQFRVDVGPIPEGKYYLDPSEISGGDPVRFIIRNVFHGDWGSFRVPLHPTKETEVKIMKISDRNPFSFFLHGGFIPGTAGCVDVGSRDWLTFSYLLSHDGNIDFVVKYSKEEK